MFTPIIILAAVSLTNVTGGSLLGQASIKPQQYIVDLGGGGGGADNSGLIELCASRAMTGNTCFYQNLHFR